MKKDERRGGCCFILQHPLKLSKYLHPTDIVKHPQAINCPQCKTSLLISSKTNQFTLLPAGKVAFNTAQTADIVHADIVHLRKENQTLNRDPGLAQFVVAIGSLPDF